MFLLARRPVLYSVCVTLHILSMIICGLSLRSVGIRSHVGCTLRSVVHKLFHGTSSEFISDHSVYIPLSFYQFQNYSDAELDAIMTSGQAPLEALGVKGTLLLSHEGYNGQVALPSVNLSQFFYFMRSLLNDRSLSLNCGDHFDVNSALHSNTFPFRKLLLKKKKSIITSNFPSTVNNSFVWSDAGEELPAKSWHDLVVSPDVMVLDCRNDYEIDMGHFVNAIPLGTNKFSESWEKLETILKDVPKDKEILAYCTGGIRCVKVGGYLKQKMGFKNVRRLKKGIIGYQSWHKQEGKSLPNAFVGENFVFDRRREETR